MACFKKSEVDITSCMKFRTILVPFLYVGYYIWLWVSLGLVLHKLQEQYTGVIIAGVLASLLFVGVQILLIYLAIRKRCKILIEGTKIHLTMFVFIIFCLGPYGMALHHEYKCNNPKFNSQLKNTTCVGSDASPSCMDIKISNHGFVMFQTVMALLALTNLFYPFPLEEEEVPTWKYLALGIEFVDAFDMMDLMSDFGCIQTYSDSWFVFFFVAMAMSAVLMAFRNGLEENGIGKLRLLKTFMTWLSTDVFFSILRIAVMAKEKTMQAGLNFLMKNIIAGLMRLIMMVIAARQLVHQARNP